MKHLAQSSVLPFAAALALFTAAGCGRDDVKVYHVATNDTAVAAMPAAMPMAMPDNSGPPKLKYTLPAGWKEKPATQMRVASFDISENGKTADVSVIPLGAMSGGDAANVNRWRGQVGQPPLAEADLQKSAEKVEIAGQPADLYDIAGTSPGSGDAERILGAILHGDDAVWYFKVTGDDALVETNKAAFTAFLKSVQFDRQATLSAPSTMDLGQLPPSHPPIGGMDMAGQVPAGDAAGKPVWTIPTDWQEAPLAQFLAAKFTVKGAGDAAASVNVSQLAGDGGGLLANANRWRQQLGLEPLKDDMELAHLVPAMDLPGGGQLTVVDFTGTNSQTGKPARLVGAVVPAGGQTWFYKLMGDPDVVAQQKDALVKFVQSAKYPDAH